MSALPQVSHAFLVLGSLGSAFCVLVGVSGLLATRYYRARLAAQREREAAFLLLHKHGICLDKTGRAA